MTRFLSTLFFYWILIQIIHKNLNRKPVILANVNSDFTLHYLINVHRRLFSEKISKVDALIRWWTLITFLNFLRWTLALTIVNFCKVHWTFYLANKYCSELLPAHENCRQIPLKISLFQALLLFKFEIFPIYISQKNHFVPILAQYLIISDHPIYLFWAETIPTKKYFFNIKTCQNMSKCK